MIKTMVSSQANKRLDSRELDDLSSYRMERVETSEEWDKLLALSTGGTVFGHSAFLNGLEREVHTYVLLKSKQTVALVYLPYSDKQNSLVLDPLLIYDRPVFVKSDPNQNRAQVESDRFVASVYLVDQLTSIYDGLEVRLSPALQDIRPMLWHNYGTSKPRFEVDVRYTSMLDISSLKSSKEYQETDLYIEMSKSRRQELRYARQSGYETYVLNDTAVFMEMYRQTFERQGLEVDESGMSRMSRLIEILLKKECAKIYVCEKNKDEPESIAIFGYVGGSACYLFGAGNPNRQVGHSGTAVLFDAMQDLVAHGIRNVDLEGINSPSRGYFKTSFGGKLKAYYRLKLCTTQ